MSGETPAWVWGKRDENLLEPFGRPDGAECEVISVGGLRGERNIGAAEPTLRPAGFQAARVPSKSKADAQGACTEF